MAVASQVSMRAVQPSSSRIRVAEDCKTLKHKEVACGLVQQKKKFLGQSIRHAEDSKVSTQVRSASLLRVSAFVESPEREEAEGKSSLPSISQNLPAGTMMVPHMNKSLSSSPGVTLQKGKLDFSVKRPKLAPKLEMGGGGRGNDNKNLNGGGDGGDDGGDDDDYLGGEGDDEGDEDNGILRKMSIVELFDRETVDAVLQEWYKSIRDLPSGFRRAVELGLMSSAQLVRFIAIDARPTIARAISRAVPSDMSRAFVGRMIADPGFIFKVGLEQALTIGTAAHWEIKQRGDRLKDEWDLALVNVLALAACNAAITWSVSPSRSYGSTARYDWQNMLQKLPNNVFDKSYPMREFTLPGRLASFVYKAAHLSLVGTVAGGAAGTLSNALVNVRKQRNPEYKPSVPVPSASNSALAYGAFLGLSGNLRYQLVYGADRFLQQNMNSLSLAVLGSSGMRYFNLYVGEPSRLAWLGLVQDKSTSGVQKKQAQAYRRQSSASKAASKLLPFDLPNIEFLNSFLSQGSSSNSGEAQAPVRRPRRKVKRKVTLAQ